MSFLEKLDFQFNLFFANFSIDNVILIIFLSLWPLPTPQAHLIPQIIYLLPAVIIGGPTVGPWSTPLDQNDILATGSGATGSGATGSGANGRGEKGSDQHQVSMVGANLST